MAGIGILDYHLEQHCQVMMIQKKINKLFSNIPNDFGIAGDILTVGFDANSRKHGVRLEQVLQRCRQANLKLNKEKCLFR